MDIFDLIDCKKPAIDLHEFMLIIQIRHKDFRSSNGKRNQTRFALYTQEVGDI